MRLSTTRLDLLACTPSIITADLGRDHAALAALLGARVPLGWPPDLWSEGALRHLLQWMAKEPADEGWGAWYVTRRDDPMLVGTVGLKGRPHDGTAEIGYTFVAEARGNGFATEAAAALVAWAFGHPEVRRVCAQTLPDHVPSLRVMQRLGFTYAGPGSEGNTVCYDIYRR
ncbi:MAG TPA: GNAT family N-acetyltransferase [Planctomycetota bacterium]|nr:GNAT family N-acetyltransferase [Planctomycetota bacterium]